MNGARFWIFCIGAIAVVITLFVKAATAAQTHNVSYDTYLSVTLTALGVILAALALFVGAAAILGYQQISAQAEKHAESAVEKRLTTLLEDSNVKQMILAHVKAEADQVYTDLQVTTSEMPSEDHGRPVAAPYPESKNDGGIW